MSTEYEIQMRDLKSCEDSDIDYQKMVIDIKAEKILNLLSFLVLADDCSEINELITLMEEAVPILKKYCEVKTKEDGES